MAAETLVDILQAITAVLNAEPLRLVPSRIALQAARQSNLVVDRSYWLDDGGLVSNRPMGAHRAARIDAVDLAVLFRGAFAQEAQRQGILDLLMQIERALIADGEAQGYHVTLAGHGVKRFGKDHLLGTLRVTVDYDFSEATP